MLIRNKLKKTENVINIKCNIYANLLVGVCPRHCANFFPLLHTITDIVCNLFRTRLQCLRHVCLNLLTGCIFIGIKSLIVASLVLGEQKITGSCTSRGKEQECYSFAVCAPGINGQLMPPSESTLFLYLFFCTPVFNYM